MRKTFRPLDLLGAEGTLQRTRGICLSSRTPAPDQTVEGVLVETFSLQTGRSGVARRAVEDGEKAEDDIEVTWLAVGEM